jgi:hypothetical protein
MIRVGFEPTSPVCEQLKTYHRTLSLNHAAVLMVLIVLISLNFSKWLPPRCINYHGSLITTDPCYSCPRINFSMGCSWNECHLYAILIFHGSRITTDPSYNCPRINFSMGCSRNKCQLYASLIIHGINSGVVSLVACKFSTIRQDRSVVTSFCTLSVVQ